MAGSRAVRADRPGGVLPRERGSTRDAKRICARCEVKENCLQYALEHDERFGIWGGLSERERRKIKRQAREAARRLAERRVPVVVCMPTPMINPDLEQQTALTEPVPASVLTAPQEAPAEVERERVPVAA
ncbi:hypothetical protein GCM10029992_02120 [Glycomyces albus]